MEKEAQEFVEALCRFVEQELQRDPDPIYSQKAVKIADARNHLFRIVEPARTDEAEDLYALADLCRLDEDTWEDSTTHEKRSAIVVILDEIEYCSGGANSKQQRSITMRG